MNLANVESWISALPGISLDMIPTMSMTWTKPAKPVVACNRAAKACNPRGEKKNVEADDAHETTMMYELWSKKHKKGG